ncbi:gp53-like domain-containing protein [Escherichia coli]
MNRTDSPKKQPIVFGVNGPREDLPDTTPSGDNTASYNSGFPPITMTLKSAGGLPPKGQDMNQILFELSGLARWASTGALNTFDTSFASSIGGYPSGAYVLGDDLKTIYRCTTNGNTANPNTITTGWAKTAQDVADILQLGTAAYRNVGTASNQIPDMSSFVFTGEDLGSYRFPGGMIVQWTYLTSLDPTGFTAVNFQNAWPTKILGAMAINSAGDSLADKIMGVKRLTDTQLQITAVLRSTDAAGQGGAYVIAWGK